LNNKLLEGGIFCDLDKAYDCVDHNIPLSKVKFYRINGKDLVLSHLDNRHCRTVIYTGSENSNKVSRWAKIRHAVPKHSVFGPLLFLLCINDLPKIINKTSAPIIFADDTSILYAHSNLINSNKKNIHAVFSQI
jgi:hypothetical protein